MIPYGRQHITSKDIKAIKSVLLSDFLTQGPVVPRFEKEISKITESKFVTAVNSATSALHIACLALGVGKNDIVWTVPNTFVASANCALYCGAQIDFVDIDPVTLNMSIDGLRKKLQQAQIKNKIPKVLIPVHFSGEPCDMKSIRKLANEFDFKVIEDASHAVGGRFGKNPIGSCEYSDITVFSFHPVKIITTGEGGAVITNDQEIDGRLKLFRSHGITRDSNLMELPNNDAWYYEQINLGFNYRMTDIHAALGLSQIERLSEYIEKRHEIAKIYDNSFQNTCVTLSVRSKANLSAIHLYVIQVDEAKHHHIFYGLKEKNIGVNVHYIPVHTQPYYINFGFKWGDFPNSEAYYRRAISLPIYPMLKSSEQQHIIEQVKLLCND